MVITHFVQADSTRIQVKFGKNRVTSFITLRDALVLDQALPYFMRTT